MGADKSLLCAKNKLVSKNSTNDGINAPNYAHQTDGPIICKGQSDPTNHAISIEDTMQAFKPQRRQISTSAKIESLR